MSNNIKVLPGDKSERKELYRELIFMSGGSHAREEVRDAYDSVLQVVADMFEEAYGMLHERHGSHSRLIVNFVEKDDDKTRYFANIETGKVLSLKPTLDHPFIEISTRIKPRRDPGKLEDWKPLSTDLADWPLEVFRGQLIHKTSEDASPYYSVFMFVFEFLIKK